MSQRFDDGGESAANGNGNGVRYGGELVGYSVQEE